MIKCAYKNILESSTVTLSAGTEDSDYPLWRIYDRDIGRLFKSTAAETIEVKVDQSASDNLAVDRLLIPAGHNLDGMTLDIKYSDNDADYYPAVTQWVQSGNGLINKSWSSATHQYWKFIITSPASIPELTELFLMQTYEWERNPGTPSGLVDDIFNVENTQTSGGQDRFIEHGDKKRQRNYNLAAVGQTQMDNITTFNNDWAGKKPFWLRDIDEIWIYGKLRRSLGIRRIKDDLYSFNFDFLEVLP